MGLVAEKGVDLLYKLDYEPESIEPKDIPKAIRPISKTLYRPNTLIELYFPYLSEVWSHVMDSFKETYLHLDAMTRQEEIDFDEAQVCLQDTLKRLYWVRKAMSLKT